jgi:uncharacterized protein YoxC
MAGSTVTLEFAGDADSLSKASKKASDAVESVGKSSTGASQDMEKGSKSASSLLDSYSKLGNAVSGASDAIDDVTSGLSALSQASSINYERQQKQERALNDVAQAQEDLNQATRDGKQALIDSGQATLDASQANLDLATATKQHADDVKKYGAQSAQAKQDVIDMGQAQLDLKQANEDAAQATRDASQAVIDAKGAQLDLNDAQREAHPPDLQKWANDVETYAPLLQGLVGVTGLITAAQWAWNAAQAASPTTWIIIAIAALVAIIVLIATKTTWFQQLWKAAWSGIRDDSIQVWNAIKDATSATINFITGAVRSVRDSFVASWRQISGAARSAFDAINNKAKSFNSFIVSIPGRIKGAFSRIAGYIAAPFRSAFNGISSAWNNTVGRLNWTVPGWVPGIGGNSIGAPMLPHFHEGGTVPGTPGSNVLAMLQGGEEVTSVTGSGRGGEDIQVTVTLDGDVLLTGLAKKIKKRGGNVQMVLGSTRG